MHAQGWLVINLRSQEKGANFIGSRKHPGGFVCSPNNIRSLKLDRSLGAVNGMITSTVGNCLWKTKSKASESGSLDGAIAYVIMEAN